MAAAAGRLRAAGTDSPRLEARLLLAHILGLTPTALLRDPSTRVPPEAQARFAALVDRRAGREPLAYILGHREFWSLDLAVSPATLIPRPDSETLVAAARSAFAGRAPPHSILDLGTGTGALLLAALSEFPAAWGVGVDRVPAAARLAAANAAALDLAPRAVFLAGIWADALAARFDLVLCNPPYIPTSELQALMPEVARHEPASALDGGADGLDAYRLIIPELPRLLSPQGVAVLELGAGQAQAVAGLARQAGLASGTQDDLAGVPRALLLANRSAMKKPFGTTKWAV
ncbi:MAG TPA: peptide chain release factor N(5)-glutamine methyltransferase [Acetobacteraceae bacterium]|nr:peptide chain release factor N(5)-glutamine methyltransferase [Acetobacteraceae bacterium]